MEKVNQNKEVSNRLCQGCIDWIAYKYGESAYFPPYQHCHHPHPEPPPCKWCEEWRKLNVTWHDTPFWKRLSYLITRTEDMKIEKCPICGAKL